MKKKVKKVGFFLLSTVMIISAIVFLKNYNFVEAVDTEESFTEGIYTYIIENGEAEITNCDKKASGSIVIPDKLGGYPVTSIGGFDMCININKITIPNTIKNIGNYTFYGCTNLTEVNIGNSVEYIGYSAFNGTEYMRNESNWKNNTLYIDNCLIEAKNISGRFAVDEGTKVIAALAFRDTNEFQLELPASLQFISAGISNINLSEIIVDKNNPYLFSDEYGVLYDTMNSRLIQYPCGNTRESYTILNGTEVIEEESFIGCKLKYVTLSNSIKKIGASAFRYCDSLVVVDTDYSVKTKGGYLPDRSCDLEGYAFADCSNLVKINLPSSISSIGVNALDSSNLKTLSFSNNVKTIRYLALSESIENIYYYGSNSDWKNIEVETSEYYDDSNLCLETATIHYYSSENGTWQIYDDILKIGLEYPTDEYNGNVGIFVEQSFDDKVFELIDSELGLNNRVVFDIKMTVDGVETQPISKVAVKIPLPDGYESDKTSAYYVNKKINRIEKINAEYIDGYLIFETNHFSYYAVVEEVKTLVSIPIPTQTTIAYGDKIKLYASIENMPANGHIEWTASNGNFDFEVSADGMTCKITPSSSGDTTFTATVYDASGNAVSKDEQEMTSKAGFFQKIIAFFKKLFRLNKTYENKI